jgi:catechol 2,3-dioxygenase-like lactoylglutathione lyase family enzyme
MLCPNSPPVNLPPRFPSFRAGSAHFLRQSARFVHLVREKFFRCCSSVAAFHITHFMTQCDIAIPVLPSRSLGDTLAFFRRLGFDGEIHSFGDYAILRRGLVELHFFTHRDLRPSESHAGCYIRVKDVESIYREFASAQLPRRGIPRQDVLEDKPWGMREFAVVDPDGNLLRVGQTLG